MTIEEFSEWFDEYCAHDSDPCINWWNENYCSKCEPEIGHYEDSDREIKFAWCELHDKCRFFSNLTEIPNTVQMTKLWLESEENNE